MTNLSTCQGWGDESTTEGQRREDSDQFLRQTHLVHRECDGAQLTEDNVVDSCCQKGEESGECRGGGGGRVQFMTNDLFSQDISIKLIPTNSFHHFHLL